MADVIRACSFQSLRFSSSSVLTSFSSTSGCLQLGLPPNQISDNKRIYPLAAASSSAGLARFSLTPRKRLLSFKVYSFTFLRTHLLELFIFAVFPDNWDVSCLCFCSNLDYWCQKSFFFSLLWDWEILGELFYSVQFIVSLIFILKKKWSCSLFFELKRGWFLQSYFDPLRCPCNCKLCVRKMISFVLRPCIRSCKKPVL